MSKLAATLLPLLVLAGAGCSVNAGNERVDSTSAAVTGTIANLVVLPSNGEMTLTWTGATGAYLVTLTGPNGYSQQAAPTVNTASVNEVAFTGLLACAPYAWTITLNGATVRSGTTNTRYGGTALCPATETMFADQQWTLAAYDHQEDGASYCGGWNPTFANWPVGYGWRGVVSPIGSYSSANFGYAHWDDPGSDPFPCPESTVTAYRAELHYDFSASQIARGIQNATLHATFTTEGGSCAANGLPALDVTSLALESWPQNSQGGLWAPIMGGPETNVGVALYSGPATYPIVTSGSSLTVNFGKPLYAEILAGFAAPNDGFGDMANGASPSFATDNNVCEATVSNAALTLSYPPMPPETPVNCTATFACGTGANVTCNASPDVFELFASDATTTNRLVGTVNASTGTIAPTFNDPHGSTAESYTVCTLNAAGATACAPVVTESVTICEPTPASVVVSNGILWTQQAPGTGTVTLSFAAPPGGTQVTLSSSLESATGSVPLFLASAITIPAGQTSATFAIPVLPTSLPLPLDIAITATANGGSASTDVGLFSGNIATFFAYPGAAAPLRPADPGSLVIYTRSGGGTVSFAESAPTLLSLPASVVMPASGPLTLSVRDASTALGSDTVTATYEGTTSSFTVTVAPNLLKGGGGGCGTTCQ